MDTLLEVPIVSATVLDEVFRSSHRESAVQKYRQRIRKELMDPTTGVSLGKAGSVQLTNVAVFTCVATAGRWKLSDGEKLARIFKKAGLVDLITSNPYKDLLELVQHAFKDKVRSVAVSGSAPPVARLLSECLVDLVAKEPIVRNIATSFHEILTRVDNEINQIKRLPGQVVRVDGPKTIVTVNNGERDELRAYDTEYVKNAGLSESGAPFVLHELSWSPDSVMHVFFPAMDLRKTDSELEQKLKALEEPLPEPPAESRSAGQKKQEPAYARG